MFKACYKKKRKSKYNRIFFKYMHYKHNSSHQYKALQYEHPYDEWIVMISRMTDRTENIKKFFYLQNPEAQYKCCFNVRETTWLISQYNKPTS